VFVFKRDLVRQPRTGKTPNRTVRTGVGEEATMTQGRHGSGGPLARSAMAYVLAGGRGSRLLELTDRRAKPAVYFGGKSRIIDFA
jgi:hypothetical protein